jgi:hypothetical protein
LIGEKKPKTRLYTWSLFILKFLWEICVDYHASYCIHMIVKDTHTHTRYIGPPYTADQKYFINKKKYLGIFWTGWKKSATKDVDGIKKKKN